MLLQVNNITHAFTYNNFFKKHEKQILNNISFQVEQGKNVALIGASGCGKSTIAKIIAQLQKPKSGNILFLNNPIILKNITQKRKFYKQVQILFQDPLSSLNPRYNVLENLQEPLHYLLNINDIDSQLKKIYPIFDKLELSQSMLYYYPMMLSGGQAQRVCIARMLLVEPLFVILDETTSGLDCKLQHDIWNFFINTQEIHNTTFLFITHDITLAHKYCEKIILMDKGSIIETIKANESFKSSLGKEIEKCFDSVL